MGSILRVVLHAVVCRRRLSSVTRVGRARGRSGGRHCTAGQYGYVPLGRPLVIFKLVKFFCINIWIPTSFLAVLKHNVDEITDFVGNLLRCL